MTFLPTGSAAAFVQSTQGETMLFLAAILVIYVVLGVLYASFIHPITFSPAYPRPQCARCWN